MLITKELVSEFRFKKSQEDIRDYIYQPSGQEIRTNVDLREWDSIVEDQGNLGSCTGNAITNAYELEVKRLYPQYFVELSKLFVYYNARILEGTINEDSGASIKNAIKGVYEYGVCKEYLCPYDISKFNTQPSEDAYDEALQRKVTKYMKVISEDNIISAINDNYPVVVGMTIFEDFLYLDKNNYTLKERDYYSYPIGGHAVTFIGYDLKNKLFLSKNSFGSEWGLNGYFYVSFDYVRDYCFEMWCFDISDQNFTITP